jgi:hypothetical protein
MADFNNPTASFAGWISNLRHAFFSSRANMGFIACITHVELRPDSDISSIGTGMFFYTSRFGGYNFLGQYST